MIKSAPVNKNENVVTLDKGTTLYQVFSDTEFLFKVTSNLETLHVYRYKPATDEATSSFTLKRSKIDNNASIKFRKRKGKSTSVNGKFYDVFTLWLNGSIYGFELLSRSAERLYFLTGRKK